MMTCGYQLAAVAAVVAMLGSTACGSGSAVPTAPRAGDAGSGADVLGVDVSCPASLLVGEKGTADSGRLSLRISDQAGTITTTPPSTVAKGGDFFLLSSTFVVPERSTEVCRTAILAVGPVTIAEPQSNATGLWCIPVRP
jgi:hypothetical protein